MTDLLSADPAAASVPQRLAPCSCARCAAGATALKDDEPPLIVEHRLRLSLDTLANLRRMARLAGEPTGIPLFSDLRRFAGFVRQVARGVDVHLRAVKAALPASASNLDAPDRQEGA